MARGEIEKGKIKRSKNVEQINDFLARAILPHRTVESIKKQRQAADYKALLQELSGSISQDDGQVLKRADDKVEQNLPTIQETQHVEGDRRAAIHLAPAANTWIERAMDSDYIQSLEMESCIRSCKRYLKLTEEQLEECIELCMNPRAPKDPAKLQEIIDNEMIEWCPDRENENLIRKPPRAQRVNKTKREQRRADYAKIQNLYVKNRSACAEVILSDTWGKEQRMLPAEVVYPFWKSLMEESSISDQRDLIPVSEVIMHVCDPFSANDVSPILKEMKKSAPGPDRVTLQDLRRFPIDEVVAHCNLWLFASIPPSKFRHGITTLIPKTAEPTSPADFRPITVASMVARLFHKVLARRLERVLPLSVRQKAFRSGDGLAENAFILKSIIEDSKRNLNNLNCTFIDVNKAFDSVSHETMLLSLSRLGVPGRLLCYIKSLYSGSTVCLKVFNSVMSDVVKVSRGVRQGDPLSPIIFNAVIDLSLSRLDPLLGIDITPDCRVNHLAFADDVVLLSRTPTAMIAQLSAYEQSLSLCGLTINPKKSSSMRISIDGKKKRYIIDPTDYLKANNQTIPAMKVTDVYKYLGVPMTCGKQPALVEKKLVTGIELLSKAPLKPQQRIFLLRAHLLTSLYHQLVLVYHRAKQLRRMDILIRCALRKWLRLPHDTPRSFFHASSKEGGLGIPELTAQIPLLRSNRLYRILDRQQYDPVVGALFTHCKWLKQEVTLCGHPIKIYGEQCSTKAQVNSATRSELLKSCDGRGLWYNGDVPAVNNWVASGTRLLSGKDYIRCLQIRIASLPTALRMARGLKKAEVRCEACGRIESLGHILQVCERTKDARTSRHNSIVSLVAKTMTAKGWTVVVEPAISTEAGIRRPDLTIYQVGIAAYVVDVTVVADNAVLDKEHVRKVDYYDVREIREWVAARSEVNEAQVIFGAVAFNWRGALSRRSALFCNLLGLDKSFLELASVRCLQGGFAIFQRFHGTTWRASAHDRR